MRTALRHLCEHGVSALKPRQVMTKPIEHAGGGGAGAGGSNYVAKVSRQVWRRPLLSKRVANTIRKEAIQNGTYGQFDTTTGIGWDPTWDVVLYSNRYNAIRPGKIQPNKKPSHHRTRESRAQKIEQHLENRLELIEEYYSTKEQSRVQDQNFEARYKRMLRGSGSGSGGPGGGGGP